DGVIKQVQDLRRVFHWFWKGHLLHDDAVALCAQVPGMLTARMVLVSNKHFVASLEIYAIGDVAVCFGGIAKQGNFVAIAADKRRQRIAELIPRGIAPYWIVLRVAFAQPLAGFVAFKNGAEHWRRTGAGGPVVEIDLVCGNQELLAEFTP